MEHLNKVTDLNYLKELSKGDEAFVKQMIDIFLTENPEELIKLEKAIQENNYELTRSLSHHMKSTISFVGLDILISKDLGEIEKLATEKIMIDTIKTLFNKVKIVCEKASLELKQ